GLAGVGREQIDRGAKTDCGEGFFYAGMVGAVETRLQQVQVETGRFYLREKDCVVSFAVIVVAPENSVRENFEKRGNHAFHRDRVALVKWNPETHDPARFQPRFAHFVI